MHASHSTGDDGQELNSPEEARRSFDAHGHAEHHPVDFLRGGRSLLVHRPRQIAKGRASALSGTIPHPTSLVTSSTFAGESQHCAAEFAVSQRNIRHAGEKKIRKPQCQAIDHNRSKAVSQIFDGPGGIPRFFESVKSVPRSAWWAATRCLISSSRASAVAINARGKVWRRA